MSTEQYIEFRVPMAHNSTESNADSPIVAIEIQTVDGDVVYWSHDENENMTAYLTIESLCESYGFDVATITAMVAS
jgi:hypothetical protein